ncbi:MAG: tRNA pseudouridine(38-40) synthase TruA [Bacteroidetes bacterium]|nr:tRNA pseudouridine(38-40) synthase TruA [Bacteroidota bacterium]
MNVERSSMERRDTRDTRFRLTIEYDGTDFVGWQLQTNGRSVQGIVEDALQHLFGQVVRVHGAGRTDAGVHADGQVAHFDLRTHLDAETIARALNAQLPEDVSIRHAEEVDAEFHARFSASSRAYVYRIAQERVSLERRTHWIVYAPLDHDHIREAVTRMHGTHDFVAFSKFSPKQTHHYCHVFSVVWEEGERVSSFHIRANRFLQGMVRCIVGGLIQVGRGRLTPGRFAEILSARDRSEAPMLAPPHGLTLTDVRYDPDERAVVSAIMRELASASR